MDTITPELWRTADLALLAEIQAERDKKPPRDVVAAALQRLRAWAALEKHGRKVHKETLDRAGRGR